MLRSYFMVDNSHFEHILNSEIEKVVGFKSEVYKINHSYKRYKYKTIIFMY